MIKRVFLFLLVNFCVIIMLSFVLKLFHIDPFLQSHGLNMRQLLIFSLVWGMGGAFISLGLSKMMAKWLMGVHIIDAKTEDITLKNLLTTVTKLAREANLPTSPEVGIYESAEVNAFATGATKKSSLIAVSRGLLNKMNSQELEGVLAHEITHIANGDMVTLTLIQGVINAFVIFLARILAFVLSGMGRNRNQPAASSFTYMLFVLLFEMIFMLLGSLVVACFSRYREYRADKGGADLAGKKKMIAALQALQKMQKLSAPSSTQPAFEAMKISNSSKKSFLWLFASHPPLDKRIERLEQG